MQKDLAGLVEAQYVGLIQYMSCNPILPKELRFFSLSPPVAMNLLKKENEVKQETF